MSAVSVASSGAAGGRLGTSGNLVHHNAVDPGWRRRLSRAQLQDGIREIVRILCPDDALRSIRLCGVGARVTADGACAVEVKRCPDTGHVAVTGTVSCGNVRGCIACASRVLRQRAEEVRGYVHRAQDAGMPIVFATLTLKHTPDQDARQQLDAVRSAWRALTAGKFAKQLKADGLVGSIRSTETTLLGKAGPHTHLHVLWFFDVGTDAGTIAAVMRRVDARWKDHAERHMDGLRPSDAHGVKWELVDHGDGAADYVAKLVEADDDWSVPDELTRSDLKRGKGGSLSPLQLAAVAVEAMREDGDMWFAEQFVRYLRQTKGTRSIVVSRGLKDALAVPESPTDEAIADAPEAMDGWTHVAAFTGQTWIAVVRRWGTHGALQLLHQHGADAVPMLLDRLHLLPDPGRAPRQEKQRR